jgi:hypothetical protein
VFPITLGRNNCHTGPAPNIMQQTGHLDRETRPVEGRTFRPPFAPGTQTIENERDFKANNLLYDRANRLSQKL